jgi:transposase
MIQLDEHTRFTLRQMQRREKDRRRLIKITVILMLDGGISIEDITYTFGIDESTVYRYTENYRSAGSIDEYLTSAYTPYHGKLTAEHCAVLVTELRTRLYRSATEVAAYLTEQFGVIYTPTGIVPLLKRLGFVYKKTRSTSSKSDAEQQEAFLEQFDALVERAEAADSFYYADAVHPQHNTRPSYGWIASGEEFTVETNTGRDRVNINGVLNAFEVSDVLVRSDARINAQSTIALYEQLQKHKPRGRIYVICDNAGYYRSRMVQQWLKGSRIVQVFLPSYSPNLNLIERLWKFLRKKVIDTHHYPTKELFREAIMNFFGNLRKYRAELERLLTLNFHLP